ncbi:MAG: recombination protein O N-terminal domain-containing protein [Verrucomicrobiae bacterium]|nr:recombination protein O N-terminal domain-containing protein [Verrucomicrobiae bacterium]
MLQTSACLIRKHRYSESSLILHWFSRDLGRIKTMAKGALRPGSSLGGRLDFFNEGQIVLSRSKTSDLHALRDFDLGSSAHGLAAKPENFQRLCRMVGLVEAVTEIEIPAPEVFLWFEKWRGWLLLHDSKPESGVQVELTFLKALGLQPGEPELHSLPPALQKTVLCWLHRTKPPSAPDAEGLRQITRWTRRALAQHTGLPSKNPLH